MNQTEVKMDDLSELPFEQILSYLSLEEVIKSRAVSRSWFNRINSFRVKGLCFSERPSAFIHGKSQLVGGAFAQNFISSSRFESFVNTFGRSILSNLKHLRLCDLDLDGVDGTAFAQASNSFCQLEELDIIRFICNEAEFELNLPMLQRIQLKELHGIEELTLNAPRLKKAKFWNCSLSLRIELVHVESVEALLVNPMTYVEVGDLENLKYLHCRDQPNSLDSLLSDYERSPVFDSLLSDLEQLREIHLDDRDSISELFEQKQRHGRTDLKIYLRGLLLYGPDDPAIDSLLARSEDEAFAYLAANPSRLADEIPLYWSLSYTAIERVAPESAINLLNRFTDLEEIIVHRPVQDIQRFLDFLRQFGNIVALRVSSNQPQELWDQLPEHCAVQKLTLSSAVSDFGFLFKLKSLVRLHVDSSIDTEFIRKAFNELPFLSQFIFKYKILCKLTISSKRIESQLIALGMKKYCSNLKDAIRFITCWFG